jgi:outer membrane protein assembly factor BamB
MSETTQCAIFAQEGEFSMVEIQKFLRAPYGVPNGLQVTQEGLWIADQITDRLALVEIAQPSEYGVTRLVRDLPSESSNTSGLAWGRGSLWLAANGPATLWRRERPTDARKGQGEILEVDSQTGATRHRWPVPGGGGVHGLEYDCFDEGHLWITTLKDQTLSKVRLADWSVQHVVPLPYRRAHGVVRVEDGVWVVHTSDRLIVKLDVEDGKELYRVAVPEDMPEPHGLSIFGKDLLYCDATSGWVVKIAL